MVRMTYPDGEILTYTYDAGRLLSHAEGVKRANRYVYIDKLYYDEFGQRIHVAYGNGVYTDYTYDDKSRRLSTLYTVALDLKGSRVIQNVKYTYDFVGNILTLDNTQKVPVPAGGEIGGPILQNFTYDNLYQLVVATGNHQSADHNITTYTNNIYCDVIGNITQKTQVHQVIHGTDSDTYPRETNYSWIYHYSTNGTQPHAVIGTTDALTGAGVKNYAYDPDGNMTGWTSLTSNQNRTIVWNEENRVKSIADQGSTTVFLYDGQGERALKRGQYGETVYVNRFYSVKNGDLASKHVFAGETRVVTKLEKDGGSLQTGVPGSIALTNSQGLPNAMTRGNGRQIGISRRLPGSSTTATTNPPLEKFEFFYHGDHLGSSNFITDDSGAVYQDLEYFPYGETWVDDGFTNSRIPSYQFTGKELDPETGLYYYGARYYDPVMSMWISPDPMLNTYLDGKLNGGVYKPIKLALYSYTSLNPIVYVDPNGLWEMYKSTGEFMMKCDKCTDQSIQIAKFEKDGSITFYAAKNMTAAQFHEVAATIYSETSPEAPSDETLGTAHVINTRAREEKTSLYDVVTEESQFFGRANDAYKNYKDNSKYTNGPGGKAKRVREGIFGMLMGEKDPTGGADMFEGADLYGTKKSKFKQKYVDTGRVKKTVQLGGTIYFKPVPHPKSKKGK